MKNKLKHELQKLLGRFDLELHTISKKRATMPGALRQLSKVGFKPKSIVDVGAAFGDWTVNAMRFFPDATYYAVEPQKEYFPALSKVAIKKIFECVLGETRGGVSYIQYSQRLVQLIGLFPTG